VIALSSGRIRLLVRIAVYVGLVLGILLLRRGGDAWRLPGRPPAATPEGGVLVVVGAEVAPSLVRAWADAYARDYPALALRVEGGGTNHALEALLERRADVAFLARAPSAAEQTLFRGSHGDTLAWLPVALGAWLVLHGAPGSIGAFTPADLRRVAGGIALERPGGRVERLYVPDPNFGWWDAFAASLGIAPDPARGTVVFLADPAAVAEAVVADPASLGLASSLAPPAEDPRIAPVPVRADTAAGAALPDAADVAGGAYPLVHRLIAACRPGGPPHAAMYLTYLASARGQRHAERAGFLPVRRVAREVYLTRHSPGTSE
jgi:ABC-type phosphate transport system substrate-binding protein